MSSSIGGREYKGQAIVLSRTNYGEADRIVHFLTPEGVVSAIARGVRKEKSKLRGGCEPWTLNEVSVRLGKGLGTVQSSRAQYLYEKIIYDLAAMEVAADIIKILQRVTRDHTDAYFFQVLRQVLVELEHGPNHQAVTLWAYLQIAQSMGVQLNLTHDNHGEALEVGAEYVFSSHDHAFALSVNGGHGDIYTANHIKVLRLAAVADLSTFLKLESIECLLPLCLCYARAILQQ
ncbi:DNA repair protein RecO [Candidatus Saccharibacteria bacterium]|nr:DNA repair protein RecO [Candidatus Saccharibacteria bacterium]